MAEYCLIIAQLLPNFLKPFSVYVYKFFMNTTIF